MPQRVLSFNVSYSRCAADIRTTPWIRPDTNIMIFTLIQKARFSVFAALLLAVVTLTADPCNGDTTARLRSAVGTMNTWLGQGVKARGWRKFLDLNTLDTQTALGEQADLQTLNAILARFRQPVTGIDHEMFVRVANAIELHIAQIQTTQHLHLIDLSSAIHNSLHLYRPPTKEGLDLLRRQTADEVRMLKRFYMTFLSDYARKRRYEELNIEEAIQFLDEMVIEMPPEVSLGKIDSMIGDQRDQLEKFEEALDALPFEEPEESEEDNDPDEPQLEMHLEGPAPPEPDDSIDGAPEQLRKKIEVLENRIEELNKTRSEIRKQDGPRLRRRVSNFRELRKIQKLFREASWKRSNVVFGETRAAINRFVDAYRYGTADNIQEDYLQRVSELKTLVPLLANPADSAAHAKVGGILLWMERHQQMEELSFAIRRRYSNPNVYVSVSTPLIQGVTSQTNNESNRIAEDFLGRFARGTATTHTNTTVIPVPNPHQAQFSIQLNGQASTNTYVVALGRHVNSAASGPLSAQRGLYANVNGLFATESSSYANMQAQFCGIDCRLRLVQKLVEKQFDKQLPETNAEATRRTNKRLADRFDSETSKIVGDAIRRGNRLAVQVRRNAVRLPRMFLRSSSERVELVGKRDSRRGLAAVSLPGERFAGKDLQLRLHDSMLNSYMDQLLGGRRLTSKQLIEEISAISGRKNLLGKTDKDSEAEAQPFRIRFPDTRPVQIDFARNRIGVSITGLEFQQGDNKIDSKLVFRWSAKVVRRGNQLFLRPEGYPEIDIPEDEAPSATSITAATLIERKIKEMIDVAKEQGQLELELPPNLIPDVAAISKVPFANELQLGLFEMTDGWLYLGYNRGHGVQQTPAIWSEAVIQTLDSHYTPASW